jgi:hypothetical protein
MYPPEVYFLETICNGVCLDKNSTFWKLTVVKTLGSKIGDVLEETNLLLSEGEGRVPMLFRPKYRPLTSGGPIDHQTWLWLD